MTQREFDKCKNEFKNEIMEFASSLDYMNCDELQLDDVDENKVYEELFNLLVASSKIFAKRRLIDRSLSDTFGEHEDFVNKFIDKLNQSVLAFVKLLEDENIHTDEKELKYSLGKYLESYAQGYIAGLGDGHKDGEKKARKDKLKVIK